MTTLSPTPTATLNGTAHGTSYRRLAGYETEMNAKADGTGGWLPMSRYNPTASEETVQSVATKAQTAANRWKNDPRVRVIFVLHHEKGEDTRTVVQTE